MVAQPGPELHILALTCELTAATRRLRGPGARPGVRLATDVDGSQRPFVPNTCPSFRARYLPKSHPPLVGRPGMQCCSQRR
jgi:hypothetical protein